MRYDYLKDALKVLCAVIVILLGVALVPDFNIKYKHFSILSDVVDNPADEEEMSSIESLERDLLAVTTDSLKLDSIPNNKPVPVVVPEVPFTSKEGVIAFEDFSANKQMLYPFYQALLRETDKRPVRIGVLGDSFIEADIMTADLRKHFQAHYGGMGVGFIPIASPVTNSRNAIIQDASGWTIQSMVKFKNADWSKFTLAGFYYIPSENATVTLKCTEEDSMPQLSLVFLNTKHTKIKVSINGDAPVEYLPEASDEVQFLNLTKGSMQSLKITFSNVDGFTGLGFYRNSETGVFVDNFSVRGSSGAVLTTISQDLTKQLTKHVQYDLLIVEYGLNVMVAEKSTYTSYRKMMISAIQHLKECYPDTPIILMSVGDRGNKNNDGTVSTHPGVQPMIDAQRDIAQKSGVVFWNTFNAMGGENSMVNFVRHKPPMASSDYIHIRHLGGSKIAEELFESLMNEKNRFAPATAHEK